MKKMFKKSFLWIVLSVFLFPAVSVAQTRVTIATVFQEYSENIVRADQRYDGQTIELIGRVSGNIRSGRNPRTERDEFYVVLTDRRYGVTIRAFFSAGNRDQIARLDQEQDVIISGRFSRLDHAGRQFILINSSVVEIGATANERQAQRVQQERVRQEQATTASISPDGVVINGVRWATRNVDTPGTFVANPQDPGGSFINRRQSDIQNACPIGWRLPTSDELSSLLRANRGFTSRNGVYGRLFGTAPNQIFLPIVDGDGRFATQVWYWGSEQERLQFCDMSLSKRWGGGDRIRCVAMSGAERAQQEQELARQEQARIAEQERLRAEEEARQFAQQERERLAEEERQERIRQEEEFARRLRDLNISLEGVVINGVRWATRNVDVPGTFADVPESRGLFFLWHRDNRGNLTLRTNDQRAVRELNERPARERRRDPHPYPCPPGWRVPTASEFQSLVDAGSIWVARNGVNGRLFGTYPNQIFLPGTAQTGTVRISRYVPTYGFYMGNNDNILLVFNDRGVGDSDRRFFTARSGSTSIRCVAD